MPSLGRAAAVSRLCLRPDQCVLRRSTGLGRQCCSGAAVSCEASVTVDRRGLSAGAAGCHGGTGSEWRLWQASLAWWLPRYRGASRVVTLLAAVAEQVRLHTWSALYVGQASARPMVLLAGGQTSSL